MLLTEGQISDRKRARIMLEALSPASTLIADRGYDSDWFGEALTAHRTTTCIPSTKRRKKPLGFDKRLYLQRQKIENLFAKLEYWRRTATRYDRCAHPFSSAICIVAAVAFYLNQRVPSLDFTQRCILATYRAFLSGGV